MKRIYGSIFILSFVYFNSYKLAKYILNENDLKR
jgi:hypothetical protein